jgi:hypothetical protein
MTPEEKLDALGLAGAEVVTREEFEALPEHRRHLLGPLPDQRYRHLRLPDPAPVAALREILRMTATAASAPVDPDDIANGTVSDVHDVAREALAEFDGTTS